MNSGSFSLVSARVTLEKHCTWIVAKLRFLKVGVAWNYTNCPSLAGIVEVEEGEVNGQELSISSHSISRISFAKEPHVEQVSPTPLRCSQSI